MSLAGIVPIIAGIATVASTAVSIFSSISGGQAEKKASERLAGQQAEAAKQAKLKAQQEAEDEKKRHQRIIATQAARYGASGLTMEGTPLLVQMESMKESEEQLRRIIEGGEVTSQYYLESAKASREAGEEALKSGYVGGVKALLSGVKSGYDWWKTYK